MGKQQWPMQHWLFITAAAVIGAVMVMYIEGCVWTPGEVPGTMHSAKVPTCGSAQDTSDMTGGSTNAGIFCANDDAGLETRMFYWEAKVAAPQGILFYLGGGPGSASSPYMFSLGPSLLSADGSLSANPNSLAEALNFNVFFLDQPAHAGYSWSPAPATMFKYSDAESALVVASAILHLHEQYKDLPVVIAGISYGTKTASLTAANVLRRQPSFPLVALSLDALLLDRIAELKNWTGVFERFMGPSVAQSLREAGLDDMEVRAGELRDAGHDLKSADVINQMWDTTVYLTGVQNQHYLSPETRYLTDGQVEVYNNRVKEHVGNLRSAFALDLPAFSRSGGPIWMGFRRTRLRDATWSLAEVLQKGVRVLHFSGYWDGMCTLEATTSWLEASFPGGTSFLRIDDPHLTADAQKALSSQSMVHVEVRDSGHGIATGKPGIFVAALKAFMTDSSGRMV